MGGEPALPGLSLGSCSSACCRPWCWAQRALYTQALLGFGCGQRQQHATPSCSIQAFDAVRGLLYLHDRTPPIIHHDGVRADEPQPVGGRALARQGERMGMHGHVMFGVVPAGRARRGTCSVLWLACLPACLPARSFGALARQGEAKSSHRLILCTGLLKATKMAGGASVLRACLPVCLLQTAATSL